MKSPLVPILLLASVSCLAAAELQKAGAPTDPTPAAARQIVLPEPANPNLPSVFFVGDSTVRNGRDDGQGKGPDGQWGWGHVIAEYFDPAKINVVNRALGGLSSRTYLTGGFWERTLAFVKSGDVVLIQLGTNDGGEINDTSRARASIKGVGDESQEIDNLLTKKHEVVHTYGWYLRRYIADTRARGATPILCSIVPRKIWDAAGHIKRSAADYAGWAQEVAAQEKVQFIDLNESVARRYDELGRDAVLKLFPQVVPDEHTHTNWAGADLNAQMVVAGLKALNPDPLASFFSAKAASIPPAFWSWAPRPPMGWNSWDCFATTVTEEKTKAQAAYMASHLKAHGWEYIIVDIQWYEPGATGFDYRKGAPLTMDGFGRLLPAPNKFPSAANGSGFKSLAESIHALGLKFGIHLMRGIPRQAVEKNLPIQGTSYRALDVANRASVCPWNPDMYGVDMARPGAQAYYDSVFALLASWGVDYVKVDDIARPYHADEIAAIRQAIDRTGRPIVLSLSPGETALSAATHVRGHANLWRISDDFWDRWLALKEQFGRLEKWNADRSPGAWPDADMLPLGVLAMGDRTTRFTPDEQRTLMTLWSIARSPLMHGGDMTRTDEATLALLTNDEVLAINQHSVNNRPVFDRDDLVAWTADVPGSPDKYLAVFNARDRIALDPQKARFASGDITRDPATAAKVDVDLKGGTRLVLVMRSNVEGTDRDLGVWMEPKFVFADGGEKSAAEFKWVQADALWDSTRVREAANGKPAALTAQPDSVIEYAIPAGAVRFTAKALVEAKAAHAGPVRFFAVVATKENESTAAGVAVPVNLADVGLAEGARVRDLWTHQDLGEVTRTFAPEVPYHGAGLYRLSPK